MAPLGASALQHAALGEAEAVEQLRVGRGERVVGQAAGAARFATKTLEGVCIEVRDRDAGVGRAVPPATKLPQEEG
jgi:hypothetical protein